MSRVYEAELGGMKKEEAFRVVESQSQYLEGHLAPGEGRREEERAASQLSSPLGLAAHFPVPLITWATCWLPPTQPHHVARLPGPSIYLEGMWSYLI